MSQMLAWSHWQFACQNLGAPQAGAQPVQAEPVSANDLELAVQMRQRLDGWGRGLVVAHYQLNQPTFLLGRRALLADDQAVRPFAPGDLVGWTLAQSERVLAGEAERLVRLLEAPLVQFSATGVGPGRWERARWAVLVCLVRLGQVVRQVARTQGQFEALRRLEAVLRLTQGRLVSQIGVGRRAPAAW